MKNDTRDCKSCHDNSSLAASQRSKPIYEGADLSGLTNIQSSAMTWDYVKRMRDVTKMKVVLKGILAWEDAKLAADAGFDGIIVSNHGGRADEAAAPPSKRCRRSSRSGTMPVLVDSGFRRGTDIVKALCMGAKGVGVGRPYLWGLGAFGQAGVERVLELLRIELAPPCSRSARRPSSSSCPRWCAARPGPLTRPAALISRSAAARASSVISAPASMRAISSRRLSAATSVRRVATRFPRSSASLVMR